MKCCTAAPVSEVPAQRQQQPGRHQSLPECSQERWQRGHHSRRQRLCRSRRAIGLTTGQPSPCAKARMSGWDTLKRRCAQTNVDFKASPRSTTWSNPDNRFAKCGHTCVPSMFPFMSFYRLLIKELWILFASSVATLRWCRLAQSPSHVCYAIFRKRML